MTASYRFGPEQTPSVIRTLLWVTVSVSILSAFFQPLFAYFFNSIGPQDWLPLSWWGLSNGFIWQPITYLFVQPGYVITFFFFVNLLFNCYFLWAFGSMIVDRIGSKPFLFLYFFSGLFAAAVALALSASLGTDFHLAGAVAPTFAILMIWTMFNPETELYFFFLFPIKAKWLLAGLVGITLLVSFSQLDFISVSQVISGILCGYLFASLKMHLKTPFAFIKSKSSAEVPPTHTPKVVDINTGKEVVADDIFMDTMLEKISKSGEKSLSTSEKRRMKEISERKQLKR